MSVLQRIQDALSDLTQNGAFEFYEGEYPNNGANFCGKIVFTGKDKPIRFMGQAMPLEIETFKVVIRGNSYRDLEDMADKVSKLISAEFIQIGGYENIEPEQSEHFMQLAVNFKVIG